MKANNIIYTPDMTHKTFILGAERSNNHIIFVSHCIIYCIYGITPILIKNFLYPALGIKSVADLKRHSKRGGGDVDAIARKQRGLGRIILTSNDESLFNPELLKIYKAKGKIKLNFYFLND
ncbi:MAG: hypothetical protein AMR96_01155 [Candidatus Adiutrix intracellularis]|nr:MAG: hypothetical protein AMR96_01155 [Candidatus Adiutrix intracellularis]